MRPDYLKFNQAELKNRCAYKMILKIFTYRDKKKRQDALKINNQDPEVTDIKQNKMKLQGTRYTFLLERRASDF